MRRLWYSLSALAASSATLAAQAPIIVVQPAATVADRTIRLRDVSNATGALGEIVLGAAALPGRSCVLSAGEIRLRLRGARANVPLDHVSVPASVTVTTRASSASVAGEALVKAAVDAVRKALPFPADDVVIDPVSVPTLPAFRTDGPLIISAGTPTLRSSRSASVPVTVLAGEETRTVTIGLRVTVSTLAVVAVKALAARTVIGPNDVIVSKATMSGAPLAARVEDVIGKRTLRWVPAGRPVALADIEDNPILAAQTEVTVRVAAGDVEITTLGTTREEGRIGQIIRVKLSSNRDVRARVADARTVVVEE